EGDVFIADKFEVESFGKLDFESASKMRFAITFDTFEDQWRGYLKENIGWFTYLSTHLYEFLFVSAALLTVLGFVRKIFRQRAYSAQEDDDEDIA
ncbi:unnamed protein product, partial [marine sediment metagenome]